MKRDVKVQTRRELGAPYVIHELVIDGRIARSQIGPFDQAEIDRLARIGPEPDPLTVKADPPRRGRPRKAA